MTGPGIVTGFRRRISILGTTAALLAAGTLPALAEDPPVVVELNRLEEQGADCRAYLLLDNRGKTAFDVFKLDLVVFDKGGVIARRLALDVGPMRAEKKGVKVFDLSGLACKAPRTAMEPMVSLASSGVTSESMRASPTTLTCSISPASRSA